MIMFVTAAQSKLLLWLRACTCTLCRHHFISWPSLITGVVSKSNQLQLEGSRWDQLLDLIGFLRPVTSLWQIHDSLMIQVIFLRTGQQMFSLRSSVFFVEEWMKSITLKQFPLLNLKPVCRQFSCSLVQQYYPEIVIQLKKEEEISCRSSKHGV